MARIERGCNSCRHAEMEYIDAYRCGYWAICGCKLADTITLPDGEEWDDEYGDTKNCPLWEESREEDDF